MSTIAEDNQACAAHMLLSAAATCFNFNFNFIIFIFNFNPV